MTDEESRLDKMMEVDRVNALTIQEEIEQKRKDERLLGAMKLMEQIQENEQVCLCVIYGRWGGGMHGIHLATDCNPPSHVQPQVSVGWLVVFYVPSTARSFREGIPSVPCEGCGAR